MKKTQVKFPMGNVKNGKVKFPMGKKPSQISHGKKTKSNFPWGCCYLAWWPSPLTTTSTPYKRWWVPKEWALGK
jgi:hypothetical protein